MSFAGIAIQLGITGGLWLINRYVLNDEKKLPKPRLESIQFAQNTNGAPIPIVYGVARIDSPVLVWAGGFGWHLDGSGRIVYEASMLLVLGTPKDPHVDDDPITAESIWFGDRSQALNLQHEAWFDLSSVVAEDGEQYVFRAEFFDGRPTQALTSYPSTTAVRKIDEVFTTLALDRSRIPGYRRQMVLALIASGAPRGLGLNPRIPSISVSVRSLGRKVPTFNTGANPALVLLDLITAPVFKIGYPLASVGVSSFEAAADTLVTEFNGCNLAIYRDEDVSTLIASICEQIDGIIIEGRATGLLILKLIRKDYVVANLPVMNEDNTLGPPTISVHGWADVANAITVKWTNPARSFEQDTATARRLGNASGSHGYRLRYRDVDFPMVTQRALAQRLAERELAQISRPIMVVNAEVNRQFYNLEVGDVVRGVWPKINVDVVLRVLEIDDGQLADGRIRLTLIEDIFDDEPLGEWRPE